MRLQTFGPDVLAPIGSALVSSSYIYEYMCLRMHTNDSVCTVHVRKMVHSKGQFLKGSTHMQHFG